MTEDMKKYLLILFLFLQSAAAQFNQPTGAELQLAVNKLSVLGSVLFIAAHPDDENTALLSYFAKGRLYRTAYLSITRGEGGQNLIGKELGSELGIIRTQELLAARRIDGAEQYFTRAIDFGFSKSPDEALRFWNKDSILRDVVWVIRQFRPDIIITRFSPTQGGHGHHLASAILAQEAFKISGDQNVFQEQLRYVRPWKAKRILFNTFRFGGANSLPQISQTLKIDIGEYNPLLGKSYTELAGISRSMHKSQGMGSPQNKGSNVNEFIVTDGAGANDDVMDGIDISWNRVKGGKGIVPFIRSVQKTFNPLKPELSIPALLKLYAALQKINVDPLINQKMEEVESLIRWCAGLWIEARAENASYSPGDSIAITMTLLNRSRANISLLSVFSQQLKIDTVIQRRLTVNEPYQWRTLSIIEQNEPVTQPYWLSLPPQGSRYSIKDDEDIGAAENKPPFSLAVSVDVEHTAIMLHVPVIFKWVDDIAGEQYRNVVVVPPVSVQAVEKNIVANIAHHALVPVLVKALKDHCSGVVRLSVPQGWSVSGSQSFALTEKNQEQTFPFYVRPDSTAASGTFTAEVVLDGTSYVNTVKTISYPHIPIQTVLEPASGKLLNLRLNKIGRSIGYIMGAGDEVPKALEQMGYAVTMISDGELLNGDLTKYDAIVAGIRSYNTREQLRISNARLLQYVENGGRYIVQYQTMERGHTDNIAPYPITISRERVTNEQAPVTFLNPKHPLLNYPNQITATDFEGWVQERGLYFANAWDKKFETVLSFADPNEKQQEGSLLVAKYGKGYYIFSGLSFFRQLPAGVEGAYRLLANLVSVGG
jgi:LmbE family N-acetylglucosaminyl deacetylase